MFQQHLLISGLQCEVPQSCFMELLNSLVHEDGRIKAELWERGIT